MTSSPATLAAAHAAGLSTALVFTAIAMAPARSALLGGRGLATRRRPGRPGRARTPGGHRRPQHPRGPVTRIAREVRKEPPPSSSSCTTWACPPARPSS